MPLPISKSAKGTNEKIVDNNNTSSHTHCAGCTSRPTSKACRKSVVGNKSELEELIELITTINIQSKNAPQLILRPVVNEIGIPISDDRKRWLLNFDDI